MSLPPQAPLGYQWLFNDTNVLAGQVSSVLSIINAQAANAGKYMVIITNPVGITTSEVAMLTYATPDADSDHDGMPDDWERAHGLIVGVDDSALDPDGDGMTNLQEYLAGTDPQDRNNVLKLDAIGAAGSSPVIQFLAVSNKVYAVQFRPQSSAGTWSTLTNIIPEITNRVVIVIDPDPLQSNRFYRVVIPAP